MHAERDYLVRYVFPRLREQLLSRRIHLVDVDLRWGVTGEQDASEVCREVITECRPFFLCILGGRYGTIPEGEERSITDDEIHFGVLDPHGERIHGLFYFRYGAVTEKMDASTSVFFREPGHSEKATKLARLKREIREAIGRPFLYQPRWNAGEHRLLGLEALGERVEREILAKIDDEFGVQPSSQLGEFVEENAAMEAFAAARNWGFVLGSREAIFDELLAHASATDGNGYLCLTGPPGSGKSALLAHLAQHTNLNNQPSTLLIRHFVGASPGSTDVRRTLRRLSYELKEGCPDITTPIPDDLEELRIALPGFLRQTCARQRVVILLDAVDQFDEASRSVGLCWLPEELPANARVILSALRGPTLEELRRRLREPRGLELTPLTTADGEAIIDNFRKRYHKRFEPEQRTALLSKAGASTPLYLFAALEELRTLATYEEINARVREMPAQAQPLFIWILKRLEADPGFRDADGNSIGPELVRRFVSYVGVSRHGLSYSELAELIDNGDARANPQGNVAALIRLLRPYLMHRGRLLDFFHGQFRKAVEAEYLDEDVERLSAHRRLAKYFRKKADPGGRGAWVRGEYHAMVEVSYHLAQGGLLRQAAEVLADSLYLQARVDIQETPLNLGREMVSLAARMPRGDASREFLSTFATVFRRQRFALARKPRSVLAQVYPRLHALAARGGDVFAAWLARETSRMEQAGRPWLRQSQLREEDAGEVLVLGASIGAERVEYPAARITCLTVVRGAQEAVSGADDGTVLVWDLETLEARTILEGHRASVLDCCVSKDGTLVATCDAEGKLILWRWGANPKAVRIIEDPPDGVPEIMCCAISPDGATLAYGRGDGTVRLRPVGERGAERLFEFEPPMETGVTLAGADELRETQVRTGRDLYFPVTRMAFFPLGESLFVFSRFQRRCETHEVSTFRLERLYPLGPTITCADLSADGTRVLAATTRGWLHLFDARDGTLLFETQAHEGPVRDCHIAADGQLGVSVGKGGEGAVWNLRRRKKTGAFRMALDLPMLCRLVRDEAQVLVGTMDGSVRLVDATRSPPRRGVGRRGGRIACLALNAGGDVAVTADERGTVTRWILGGEPRERARADFDVEVSSCAVAPAGGQSAFGCADGRILLWEDGRGRSRTLEGCGRTVGVLRYVGSGSQLLAGDAGGTIRLWDVTQREPAWTIEAHDGAVSNCVLREPENWLISAGEDHQLLVRTLPNRAVWWSLRGWIRWLAPDGSFLVARRDGGVEVLDTITLDSLARLGASRQEYDHCLPISGGTLLAMIGESGTVLWAPTTQRPLASYATGGMVTAADVKNRTVCLGFRDGSIRCFAIENLSAGLAAAAPHREAIARALRDAKRQPAGIRIWAALGEDILDSLRFGGGARKTSTLWRETWLAAVGDMIALAAPCTVSVWNAMSDRERCLAARNTPCDLMHAVSVIERLL